MHLAWVAVPETVKSLDGEADCLAGEAWTTGWDQSGKRIVGFTKS